CMADLLSDLNAVGMPLEAYRAVPDRRYAMQTLGHQLVFKKKFDDLEKLLMEHGKQHAGDAMHAFFTGELHLFRGAADLAEKSFPPPLGPGRRRDSST